MHLDEDYYSLDEDINALDDNFIVAAAISGATEASSVKNIDPSFGQLKFYAHTWINGVVLITEIETEECSPDILRYNNNENEVETSSFPVFYKGDIVSNPFL